MHYTDFFLTIASEIDILMSWFVHTKKDIWYWWRRTFINGQWFDCVDYKKKWEVILRVGRGAWLVRTYPILHWLFDEVMIVLAKLHITDISLLYDKHMIGLFELLEKAPTGIGAFD